MKKPKVKAGIYNQPKGREITVHGKKYEWKLRAELTDGRGHCGQDWTAIIGGVRTTYYIADDGQEAGLEFNGMNASDDRTKDLQKVVANELDVVTGDLMEALMKDIRII